MACKSSSTVRRSPAASPTVLAPDSRLSTASSATITSSLSEQCSSTTRAVISLVMDAGVYSVLIFLPQSTAPESISMTMAASAVVSVSMEHQLTAAWECKAPVLSPINAASNKADASLIALQPAIVLSLVVLRKICSNPS